MKRASLPASPGFWTCVVVCAVLVLGGGTGLLAWLTMSNNTAVTAQSNINESAAPSADQAYHNPMRSLGASIAARQSVPVVQTAVHTQPLQSDEDEPGAGSPAGDVAGHAAVTDSAHSMLSDWHAAGATLIEYEPGAHRLLADATGATRVLEFDTEAYRSLLDSSGLDAGLREKSNLIEVNDYWAPHNAAALQDLDGGALNIADFTRGVPEDDLQDFSAVNDAQSMPIDASDDAPQKVGSAAGAQLQYSDDPSSNPRPETDSDVPTDIAMAPGKPGTPVISDRPIDGPIRDDTNSPRLVPEPMTMPVLICGWMLIGRPRRRRIADGPAKDDERSFKLPPGSSDLTIDQLYAARRITVAAVPC